MVDKKAGGRFIKARRKAVGITQEELREMINASVTTVSNWETGQTAPGLEDVNTLAAALDTYPSLLLEALGISVTPSPDDRIPKTLRRNYQVLNETDRKMVEGLAERLAGPRNRRPPDPEEPQ